MSTSRDVDVRACGAGTGVHAVSPAPACLRFALLVAVATAASPGCGGGSDAIDWSAYPTNPLVTYMPGTPVEAAHATIDAAGGTLAAPDGSALAGVVVTFPAGTVTAPTTFTLAADAGGSFANTDPDEHPVVMSITSDGQRVFTLPISVTFPFADATRFPVAYHVLDDAGTLEVMTPLPMDRVAGRGGFLTFHLSKYAIFDPADPRSEDAHRQKYTAFSGFLPAIDGFAIRNNADEEYTPAGRCQGMATFARWYKTDRGGGLARKYEADVPTKTLKDVITEVLNSPMPAQEVVSIRAQIATNLKSPPPDAVNAMHQDGLTLGDNLVTLLHALQNQPGGVLMGLSNVKYDIGHVVVAVGANDGKIGVYDPNSPGKTKEVTYAFTSDKEGATISYPSYDYFGLWGNGEIPPVGDDFARITDDAEAGFHGENRTLIEITSPAGTKVDSQDVSLEGKVHSGVVEIGAVEVTARYPDSTLSDPQTLALAPGQKDFTFPLKLKAGENIVLFRTRGLVVGGAKAQVPNTRGDVPSDDWLKLTWGESPRPDNLLGLKYSRTEITGDSRIDTSVELTTYFKYTINPDLPAALKSTDFPWDFDNCTSYGGCDLIRGQTYAGTIDGDWLPIHVTTNHEDRYHRDTGTGEWKLDSTTDDPRDVICEWIGVYVFVEPGSMTGSYRYRLALTRAGNIRCPSGQNQLPFLGESMEMTDGVAEGCQQPPRVTPAEIDPWAQTPTGAKVLSLSGYVNCSDGGGATTETATVELTLVSCNGAPCLL